METKIKHIRIIDDDKLDELYERMISMIFEYDVTIYETLGVLECVKCDILNGEYNDEEE